MALTWAAAASGILRDWDRTPPPFAFLVLGVVVVSLTLSLSPVGTRIAQHIPIWMLVAIQGFRLPLEARDARARRARHHAGPNELLRPQLRHRDRRRRR